MESYSSRTIDELGRLILHKELRQKLGLSEGDKVSLKIIDNIIILKHEKNSIEFNGVICQIDEFGRITLPSKIKEELGWKEKDKISSHNTGNLIILTAA